MAAASAVAAATIGICGIAGCGGASHSEVAVRVTVTQYVFEKTSPSKRAAPHRVSEHFTLDCEPTAGTLPFAARICRDIVRHRRAMLAPRQPRSTCGGGPFMAVVDVAVLHGFRGGGFSASPGCGWPGGTPAALYDAASTRNARALRLLEPRLRCDDDPAFFARPTPWASIAACTRGLWTPLAERAIALAKTSPALRLLRPAILFPADPGVVRCRIGARPHLFDGLCGVGLTGPASSKLVHFVETWAQGGRVFRHRWTIHGRRLVGERGPTPPQLRA